MEDDEREFLALLKTAPSRKRPPKRRRAPAPVIRSRLTPRERQQARYGAYLKTPHWRRVRNAILERDGYRCRGCGSAERLEVHHLTYERLGRAGCHRSAHMA